MCTLRVVVALFGLFRYDRATDRPNDSFGEPDHHPEEGDECRTVENGLGQAKKGKQRCDCKMNHANEPITRDGKLQQSFQVVMAKAMTPMC